MINFSWKSINDKFGWNAYSVLEYFYLKQGIDVPPFLRKKIPKGVKLAAKEPYSKGACFIIEVDKALKEATDPSYLYVYLELASMRNKFDYIIRGVKHLPLAMVPDYLLSWVEINPMLEVKNENIYFKYEQE